LLEVCMKKKKLVRHRASMCSEYEERA